MAGRAKEIKVDIKGDADFSAARKDIEADYAKIERATKDTVADIERAFGRANLSPEIELAVDTADLARAFDLAEQLDRATASITVESDISELQQAEALARSLRQFTARLDLDVDGTNELREALGLAESLDRVAKVKLDVQGKADLDRAEAIARSLDGEAINLDVKVDDSELTGLGGRFGAVGSAAGEAFSGGFDVNDVGSTVTDGLTGVLATAGPWAAVALGLGAAFADDFSAGFSRGFSGSARGDLILTLRGNLSADEMEAVGRAGAAAYNDGFGESLAGVKETAALIQQELSDIDPKLDLSGATRQAEALAEVFGVDVAESIRAVDSLVSRGLVPSTKTGFDLLFELGQQTGQEFDETLEVVNEFGAALTALGVDGPQGLYLIGEALRNDVYAQADQAGEVFEEFNEIVSNGQAAEAIATIGLNAAEMQDKVADGRGAEAMGELARALLLVKDEGDRTALAVEIFGGNINRATDKQYALELLAQADGFREVEGGAADSAEAIAATQTEWDKFSKSAEEAGVDVGNAFATAINSAKGFAERIPGIGETEESLAALEIKLGSTSDAFRKTGEDASEAAGGIDDTTLSVEELDAALSAFSGRFDADATFRNIVEDSAAAAEAVAGLTSSSYDLGAGFDISTEAGRNAEAALEDLSGNLDDLIKLQQEGQLEAGEFAAAHAQIEAAVRLVADQMNLTEAETQDLIDRYTAVPDDLNTNVGLTDNATTPLGKVRDKLEELTTVRRATVEVNDNATTPLQKIKDKLDSIRSKTVTVTSVTSSVRALERAVGGPSPAGVPTLVGEEGPELRVFDKPGYIYTAAETRALLANAKVDGPLNTAAPAAGRSGPHINIEQVVVDKGRDLWQDFRLAEDVYAELLR